jgi:hypothetical protein
VGEKGVTVTLKLPTSWGPATYLVVLYAVAAAIGGLIEVYNGDMSYEQFIESMKFAAGATGLLAIGRGVARGGPGTGFSEPKAPEGGTNIPPVNTG